MIPKLVNGTKHGQTRTTPPVDADVGNNAGTDTDSLAPGAVPKSRDSGHVVSDRRSYLESLYLGDRSGVLQCIGELIVDREADPSDVAEVYKALLKFPEAELLYARPSSRGRLFVCGIKDLGSFLARIHRRTPMDDVRTAEGGG